MKPSVSLFLMILLGLFADLASAMPEFARRYGLSCAVCHAAFPRLSPFGRQFAADNYKLPNWRESTEDLGDELLMLPKYPPIALRAQAYVQARDSENIDPVTGARRSADTDFQAPYLIKLLSSAPLSEHITYYFYGILAEKGGNGEAVVEDAWFRHDDLFGSRIGMQLGQFQVSDLMFPRELRLTFQDFMVYRMAGITYDRGVLFDRGIGPVEVAFGLVNGNGIDENFDLNSPGYQRPDNMFDNDNSKSVFGRIGASLGPISLGVFALDGSQASAAGPAGLERGNRDSEKRVYGVDLSGQIGGKTYWFVQYLWSRWGDFLDAFPRRDFEWSGGFAGVDYIANPRWAFSALYNHADAGDLDGTDTIYEGIDIDTLTLTASYYFMRNVKGVGEVNVDLQDKEAQSGSFFTGHLTQENYVLFGFDAAF